MLGKIEIYINKQTNELACYEVETHYFVYSEDLFSLEDNIFPGSPACISLISVEDLIFNTCLTVTFTW